MKKKKKKKKSTWNVYKVLHTHLHLSYGVTPSGEVWQEENTSTVSCLVNSKRMATDTNADPSATGGVETSAKELSSAPCRPRL